MKDALLLLVALLLWCPSETVRGQIVRFEVDGHAPYRDGVSFGSTGAYERLTGTAYGEVDPADPLNAGIVDILHAPVNERGRVEYAAEFALLKPVDLDRSNGILRYMAPNRGRSIPDLDSLFLADGTVFVWGAWQGDIPDDPDRLGVRVPVAVNPDGSPITGRVRVEFVGWGGEAVHEMPLQGNAYNSGQTSYPPAAQDNTGAVLTRRVREKDPRIFVPNDEWAFATCNGADNPFPGTPSTTSVCLKGGFEAGYLYELVYEARDPGVMGLGLAAVRDLVTYLRTPPVAGDTTHPLGDHIQFAIGAGVSQSGNFMKTFVHLGFNEGLDGAPVFESVFPLVAARQTNINMRFAVPGGGGGVRLDHRAFGQSSARGFPADYYDAVSGHTGGIFERCSATATCPNVFLLLSGSEMWALQGSPVLTDAYGTSDLDQPDQLRIYYVAGTQHGTSPTTWNPATTTYPSGSRSTFDAIVRALWVRLEAWTTDGTPPPVSRIPRVDEGTLVRPEALRYPDMQGATFPVDGTPRPVPPFEYRGLYNALGLLDFGSRFEEADESGIADFSPPAYLGKDYAILVSAVDDDGNEVSGIQPVGNAAPLGTNLPYAYAADEAAGDLFWLSGTFIPFHETRAARLAAGDERRSLEERYGDHAGYVSAVREAAEALVREGFLLPGDAERIVAEAEAASVLK